MTHILPGIFIFRATISGFCREVKNNKHYFYTTEVIPENKAILLCFNSALICRNEKLFQYTDTIKGDCTLTPRVPVVFQDHISVQGPLSRAQSAFFFLSEVHSHYFEVHSLLKQDTHSYSAGYHFLPVFREEKFDRWKKENLMAWKQS